MQRILCPNFIHFMLSTLLPDRTPRDSLSSVEPQSSSADLSPLQPPPPEHRYKLGFSGLPGGGEMDFALCPCTLPTSGLRGEGKTGGKAWGEEELVFILPAQLQL